MALCWPHSRETGPRRGYVYFLAGTVLAAVLLTLACQSLPAQEEPLVITDTEALIEALDAKIAQEQAPASIVNGARQRLAGLKPRLTEIAEGSAFVGWSAFVMPTGAMEDTLLVGDRFLVSRVPAGGGSFHDGELVVLHSPVHPGQEFTKRIVGVPGDRIRIVQKALWRNGKPVEEPYVTHKTNYLDSYRDQFPSTPNTAVFDPARDMLKDHVVDEQVVVPEGHYFVMGDNRDMSLDSRYWGLLPAEQIFGRPIGVYWSEQRDVASTGPGSRQVRWERIGLLLE